MPVCSRIQRITATLGCLAISGGAATAQTYEYDDDYREQPQQRSYERMQSGQQDDGRSSASEQRRFGAPRDVTWRAEPVGWTFVAFDTDDDGNFDTYEHIWAYDLERARHASNQRRMQGAGDQQFTRGRMPAGPGRGERSPRTGMRAQQTEQLSGTLEDIKSVRLVGMQESHAIAKIRTDQGRLAKVDLGPKGSVENLNISRGDRLTVSGTRGTINDKIMLMADRVTTDSNRTLTINRGGAGDQQLRRVRGEIVERQTAQVRQTGQQHLIATLRTNQGQNVKVDFGPQDQVPSGVKLTEGQTVIILAQRGRLNRQPALFAEQVSVQGGRSFSIARPQVSQYMQAGDIQVRTQQPMQGGQSAQSRQPSDARERQLQQREQQLQQREQQLQQREQQLEQREQRLQQREQNP